jgi:hypothetical protein
MWVKTQTGSLVNLERIASIRVDTMTKPDDSHVGRVVALNENRELVSVMWAGDAAECVEVLEQLVQVGFPGSRIIDLGVGG